MRLISRLLHDEEAATAVEYAVMLGLVLLAVVGAVSMVGAQSGGLWSSIDGDLESAGFGS